MGAWVKRDIGAPTRSSLIYNILVDHHAVHSIMKHGGCNSMKTFIELNLMEDVGAGSGRRKFVKKLMLSGHEHLFGYGTVSAKEIRQAIIGGTRFCDGLALNERIRDRVADTRFFTGRGDVKAAQIKGV